MGLDLNASKTKILHADSRNADVIFDVAEIDGAFIEILLGEAFHRYLDRRINLSAARYDIEFNYRKQQAWFAFKKHEKLLLNKHASLKNGLHYFDVCITPCVLFALAAFPITRSRLEHLNILQRKMLRRIIGWRRIADEDWKITMERMNKRLEAAYQHYEWLHGIRDMQKHNGGL